MSYLLRVKLPDVPGSLGRLASAIGEVGGNINAIEIVDKYDDYAVDDVFLEADPRVMPDTVVSACNRLDEVSVLWISRYAGAGTLFLDLELVEDMTADPDRAMDHLIDMLPHVFRVDWGMRLRRVGDGMAIDRRTSSAPSELVDDLRWPVDLQTARRYELSDHDLLLAACPVGSDQMVVIARRGGPELLDSEIARLNHLVSLASSVSR